MLVMNEIRLLDEALAAQLHDKALHDERRRINYDLRTTPEDGSQRMLNVLEIGTKIPIHRHLKSSETVVCIEGSFDEVFYEEMPNLDSGRPTHDGEKAWDESCFMEVARFRICPREGLYGIQIPRMSWHTLIVHEPSVIFEAKDGRYEGNDNKQEQQTSN